MTVTGSSRGAATTAATDLKAKHRAMWASGDYAGVAEQVIPTMGQALVEACRVQPGQRVLDVAAGSGNAAIPAARLGADVVAADLTPELLEADAGKLTTACDHAGCPIRVVARSGFPTCCTAATCPGSARWPAAAHRADAYP